MQSAVLAMIDSVMSVCLSDGLSVTVRYHVKTTPATIMTSSLDCPMTLVCSGLTSDRNSKGNIGSRGAE